jgi:hypothetical protein
LTGAVILAPSGDQTIATGHQLINRGTEQVGTAFGSFDANIQANAFDPSTGVVGISVQALGANTVAIQALAQGAFSLGIYSVASTIDNGSSVPAQGGEADTYYTTTGNSSFPARSMGNQFLAAPAVGTTMSSRIHAGLQVGSTNLGLGTVTTAQAIFIDSTAGGPVTQSWGIDTQSAFAGSGTTTAIVHADDQGAGATHYGIFFEGVTHNDLGGGITKVGNLTISGIAGSTQCLHINSSGVVSGTGSDCGSGGGGGTWGSITGTLSSQTDLQTALNGKLATGLAVLLAPGATQTIQPTLSTAVPLITKCPASAATSLACLQVQDNTGANVVSFLQNDTTQFGVGVGGQITLTDIVGPNSNPATTGQVRVSTTDSAVCWRSNDNTVNYCLAKTAANIITSDLALAIKETAAGSGIAGYGVLYADSTTHLPMWSANNGSFLVIPQETGSMTSGHLVSVNATTNLIADSGVVAANVLTGTATNHGVAVGGAAQALSFTTAGTAGQCLISNGASSDPSFQACGGGSSTALSAVTAAAAGNSINSGDNAQVWNWSLTTASQVAFKFSENSASTSTGTPVLVAVSTIASSTLNPFQMDANGNGLRMDTTGKLAKIGTGSLDVNSLSSITGSGAAVLATGATNVTLDAEASGNVMSRPHYVEYRAQCNNATPSYGNFNVPTSAAAGNACFGTTMTQGVITFADATTSTIVGQHILPLGFTGNFDVRIYWFANASSANAVRWSFQIGCSADGQAVSTGATLGTASTANTAYTGTANQQKTTLLSAVSTSFCSAGETAFWSLSRIGADAGDTLAATANVLAVVFDERYTN